MRNEALESWKEDEWDLDLMTAPGYVHGRNSDEGETDTREFFGLHLPCVTLLRDWLAHFLPQLRCSGDSFHLPHCEGLACGDMMFPLSGAATTAHRLIPLLPGRQGRGLRRPLRFTIQDPHDSPPVFMCP
jgi:hypothetical protein